MTENVHPATVAIGQIESVRSAAENLAKVQGMVETADSMGAKVLVFPEYLMSWGPGKHGLDEMAEIAEPLDGPFVSSLRSLARNHGLWIVGGIIEAAPPSKRPFNTTVVIDQAGTLRATYRKSHLFDAFGHCESDTFASGDTLFHPIETPLGQVGLFVCYELRFPEVARSQALAAATVLLVPSAWVAGPIKDLHWITLLRVRAVENGCYVVAAAQVGNEFAGQSVIIDPMGVTVAQAGETECVISGVVSPDRLQSVRNTVPSLAHRRPELY